MTPEARGEAGWPELAAWLRSAAARAGEAARRPPLTGAEALLEPLAAAGACLEQAGRLLRSGNREGIEPFRQELERWGEGLPGLRAWVEVSSALAAGWAAAAGVSPGYSPAGQRPRDAAMGRVSHSG